MHGFVQFLRFFAPFRAKRENVKIVGKFQKRIDKLLGDDYNSHKRESDSFM